MKKLTILLGLLLFGFLLQAREARLLRFPHSVGDKLVFSYAGDLYIVSTEGGTARRLTSHVGYEMFPRISPDGKYIAFTGQYDGNTEVFVIPAEGGEPRRLTYTATLGRDDLGDRMGPNNIVIGWTPDSKHVLYRSRRYTFNDFTGQLFTVPVEGGMSEELPLKNGGFASYSPDGKKLAYNYIMREFRAWKRYQGGMADDIRVFDLATKKSERITDNVRQDIIPMWSPDGNTIYYISDRGDIMNLYAYDVNTKEDKQLTSYKEYDIKFPAIGDKLIVYEQGGYIYGYDLQSGKESKITINIDNDQVYSRPTLTDVSGQISSIAVAPGGERVVVAARGDIFSLPVKEGITYNLTTSSDANDMQAGWSPDGKWFAMEIIGNRHDPYSDIAIVSADGKGEVVNLTNSGYFDSNPRWVLDGNAILFSSERYGMRNHASWGSLQDVMIVFMNQDAYDKFRLNKEDYELLKEEEKRIASLKNKEQKEDQKDKKGETKPAVKEKKNIEVELQGIEDRVMRLTPNSSQLGDAILSKNGDKLYYMASFEGGMDLWVSDLRSRSTKVMHKLNSGWASLEMDKDGKDLFLLGGRSMQKISLGSERRSPIAYSAEMKLDQAAEQAYMFDRVRRQEAKRFYEKNMHGVDWAKMTKAYEKFLPYINNNYDFSELLSELLGELNVSHTGSGYRPGSRGEATAELGLLLNVNYAKDGLLVDEVLEKGPFDNVRSKLKAGMVIEKIDGQAVKAGEDYYPLLRGKSGKRVLFSIYDPSTKERWDEVIEPISKGTMNGLLYRRWVKQRAADVDRLSGGRLGYVHISSMDDPSFRSVYADILGKYNDREGIVIDTRFNGGGRLHEDIEILFSGKKYFTQVVRGREACDMPSRRWNKPSIMVTCEANYSNAHGTPWVYQHQGIGKVVGMPVPGTMTSVSWETLQDPTLYFGIPIVGYRLPDGSYLENKQLEPDVKIANSPEKIIKGEDEQLETAVKELLKEIDSKK